MSKQKKIIDTYLSGKYDSAVNEDFVHWLDSPFDADLKQEAFKSAWEEICSAQNEVPSQETDNAFEQLRSTLASRATGYSSRSAASKAYRRKKFIHAFRSAALVALPLVASAITYVLLNISKAPEERVAVNWEEVYCPYGRTMTIDLADGSRIKLNAGSRLVYPDTFTGMQQERKVFLSGEAYAEIAKDPERKFIVSANDLDIVVHGTSFNVRSYPEDSEVEVMLVEGAIDLKTKSLKNNRNISLSPGDLVRVDHKSGNIRVENVPTDAFRADSRLTFVNRRLGDITSQLERVFDVHIIIESHNLEDQRYLASFVNGESLDEILRLLRRTGHLKYEYGNDKNTIYLK